jgi:hypothetical protein
MLVSKDYYISWLERKMLEHIWSWKIRIVYAIETLRTKVISAEAWEGAGCPRVGNINSDGVIFT